jgi:hypothetical protein
MEVIQYMIISTLCLSLFYLAYRLIFKKDGNFRQMRFFLLGSITISLLVPLNSRQINLGISLPWNTRNSILFSRQATGKAQAHLVAQEITGHSVDANHPGRYLHWKQAVLLVYGIATFLLLLRIFILLGYLGYQYLRSRKVRLPDCTVLYNPRFKSAFSFFRMIFIPADPPDTDLDKILAHEKVHVAQYHSIDLLLFEIVASIMWFNPLIWKMKNTVQLVHEYLADEGALETGIDRLQYQELLINQIAGAKLISLSSSFNHSLTKKRMMMIQNKMYRKSRFKFMALLPLSALLLIAVSCLNGIFSETLRAGGTGTGSRLKYEPVLLTPNSKLGTYAGDTVRKTIVRIVQEDSRKDTVVINTEKYEIPDGDSIRYIKVIRYTSRRDDADINTGTDVNFDVRIDENELDSIINGNDIRGGKTEEIVIVRKRPDTGSPEELKQVTVRVTDESIPSNTLVIVDGVQHTGKDALEGIDPDQIVSVEVNKDKKAIKKYTDKNYDGVIVVVTKKGSRK